MNYERIIQTISDEVWAIIPSQLERLTLAVECQMRGVNLLSEAAIRREVVRRQPSQSGSVAILPLFGILFSRPSFIQQMLGTSTQKFGTGFDEAMDNPNISAVIIDVDSAGGMVAGTRELADKIRSRRREKSGSSG